jgi:hypothetical protein
MLIRLSRRHLIEAYDVEESNCGAVCSQAAVVYRGSSRHRPTILRMQLRSQRGRRSVGLLIDVEGRDVLDFR